MYTGATFDSSGQFYSPQYESLTYFGSWQGVGRSINGRMSYRNHYMCSSEATSMVRKVKPFRMVFSITLFTFIPSSLPNAQHLRTFVNNGITFYPVHVITEVLMIQMVF